MSRSLKSARVVSAKSRIELGLRSVYSTVEMGGRAMVTIRPRLHQLCRLFLIGGGSIGVLLVVICSVIAVGYELNPVEAQFATSAHLSDAELALLAGKEETYCTELDCTGPWQDGDCKKCVQVDAGNPDIPQCPATVYTYGDTVMCFDCEGEGCVAYEDSVIWQKWQCKNNGAYVLNKCCEGTACDAVTGCFAVKCRKCAYDGNDPIDEYRDTLWECDSE